MFVTVAHSRTPEIMSRVDLTAGNPHPLPRENPHMVLEDAVGRDEENSSESEEKVVSFDGYLSDSEEESDSSVISERNDATFLLNLRRLESKFTAISKCALNPGKIRHLPVPYVGGLRTAESCHASSETSIQAADSVDTAWTDEKHSLYLNSMEAMFVQKLYKKEYCAVDVCGLSSQSDPSFDLECVESHPSSFRFGFRKARRSRKIASWQCFPLSRPRLSASAVFENPWVQHFRKRNVGSTSGFLAQASEGKQSKHSHGQDEEQRSEFILPCKRSLKEEEPAILSTRKGYSTWQTRSSNHGDNLNATLGCKERENNSAECLNTMKNPTPHRFKKLKCKQELVQVDLEMECFHSWHHGNISDRLCIESDVCDVTMQQRHFSNNKNKQAIYLRCSQVSEVPSAGQCQPLLTDLEKGSYGKIFKELSSYTKMDQVVPSQENVKAEQTVR